MPYNRDLKHYAPLPSGALPTTQELDKLGRKAWAEDLRKARRVVGRLFS